MSQAKSAEKVVQEIRRKTRRQFSAEENIRIVLEGLRGEESIAALCRREGLNPNLYYRWSKEFLEAGKKRLLGDTTREATSNEVTELRKDVSQLKQVVAELVLEHRLLKKSVTGFDLPAEPCVPSVRSRSVGGDAPAFQSRRTDHCGPPSTAACRHALP